jgi:hypothetical protein
MNLEVAYSRYYPSTLLPRGVGVKMMIALRIIMRCEMGTRWRHMGYLLIGKREVNRIFLSPHNNTVKTGIAATLYTSIRELLFRVFIHFLQVNSDRGPELSDEFFLLHPSQTINVRIIWHSIIVVK